MQGKTIHPVLNLDLSSHNSNEELYSFLLRDNSFITNEPETVESDRKSNNMDKNADIKSEDGGTEASDLTMVSNTKNIETKPETSCIIICPQPLPRDIYSDGSKQKNYFSLRLLSIDDILAHNVDCNSELLFEVIMAVEILKSVICTHFANIIVSFILSEHENVSSAIDSYICRVVKKLRQINNKIISSNCATEEEKTQSSNNINNAEDNASKIVEDNAKIKKSKVDLDETTTIDFEINRDPTIIATKQIFDATLNSVSEISETESRHWRRNFLNSCKWFDKDHVSYIPFEILELIFYLSDIPASRELTQKEIYTICSKLCKEDNKKLSFRYESFV